MQNHWHLWLKRHHAIVSISFGLRGLYLPGSSVRGTSQVKILEWVAILFSRASAQTRD